MIDKKYNAIFRHEIRKYTARKYGALFELLLPAAVFVVFCFLFRYGRSIDETSRIVVYASSDMHPIICGIVERENISNVSIKEGSFQRSDVLSGTVTVAVVVSDRIELYFDSSHLTDFDPVYQAETIADYLSEFMTKEHISYGCLSFEKIDVSTARDNFMGTPFLFFSVFIFVGLFLLIDAIGDRAMEMVARPIEEGSFDMVRLSPVPLKTVMLAKFTFVLVFATVISMLFGVSLYLGVRFLVPDVFRMLAEASGSQLLPFVLIFISIWECNLLCAAGAFLIGAVLQSVKKMSTALSVCALIVPALMELCSFVSASIWRYIPALNLWKTFEDCLERRCSRVSCLVGIGLTLILAAVIYFLAVALYERKGYDNNTESQKGF